MSTWIPQAVLMGATGPAGGVFGSAIADFGSSDNGGADAMSVTVTVAAAWVTSTSYPIVEIGPGGDHTDADDLTSEEVYALVTNIQIATSFDIEVFAPNGTWGQWLVNWGAALTGAAVPPHAVTHSNGTDNVTLAESQITGLVTDLAAKTPTSRTITAGDGMTGGGDLAANRTLAVDGTVLRSTDARLGLWTPSQNGLVPGNYNSRIRFDDFEGTGIGSLGWNVFTSGAGAAVAISTQGVDATSKCRGVVVGGVGSASTGNASIYLSPLALGLGALEQDFRIAFSALPTAAQQYVAFPGLIDTVAGSGQLNYITFVVAWGASAAVIYGQCAKAGTPSTTPATTVAWASNEFHKLQILINAAWTSIRFLVDGVEISGSPLSTNIPIVTFLYPTLNVYKTIGTTPVNWYIDSYYDNYQYTV
jgi:hypothetical protein